MATDGARILLVEDDFTLCTLIERNLCARGHQLYMAHDAQQALDKLRLHPIDLLLLDVNLPDQTGWEVLRIALRESLLPTLALPNTDADGKIPVIVLSAVRVSLTRLSSFRPLAYLPKPFPMEALLRLASEATQRRINR